MINKLEKELQDLQVKMIKLNDFLMIDIKSLDEENKDLLLLQYKAMEMYSDILAKRIRINK